MDHQLQTIQTSQTTQTKNPTHCVGFFCALCWTEFERNIHRFELIVSMPLTVKSLKNWGFAPNPIIKLSNESNKLIPEATNREPSSLIEVAPVHIAIVVKQEAEPGTVGIELRITPPVTVLANVVEWSTVVTATARKT